MGVLCGNCAKGASQLSTKYVPRPWPRLADIAGQGQGTRAERHQIQVSCVPNPEGNPKPRHTTALQSELEVCGLKPCVLVLGGVLLPHLKRDDRLKALERRGPRLGLA